MTFNYMNRIRLMLENSYDINMSMYVFHTLQIKLFQQARVSNNNVMWVIENKIYEETTN